MKLLNSDLVSGHVVTGPNSLKLSSHLLFYTVFQKSDNIFTFNCQLKVTDLGNFWYTES